MVSGWWVAGPEDFGDVPELRGGPALLAADVWAAPRRKIESIEDIKSLTLIYRGDPTTDEGRRIARLIAAAPELLEALHEAEDFVSSQFENLTNGDVEPPAREPLALIRAAIAKAEGRAPGRRRITCPYCQGRPQQHGATFVGPTADWTCPECDGRGEIDGPDDASPTGPDLGATLILSRALEDFRALRRTVPHQDRAAGRLDRIIRELEAWPRCPNCGSIRPPSVDCCGHQQDEAA